MAEDEKELPAWNDESRVLPTPNEMIALWQPVQVIARKWYAAGWLFGWDAAAQYEGNDVY